MSTSFLNQRLCQLIAEACIYPPKSFEYRAKCTEIYTLVMESKKLYPPKRKDNREYYNDALHEMWVDCFNNLETYNPSLEELRQLFLQACSHPLGSEEYDRELKKVYELVSSSGWNWRDKTVPEILQFCQQHGNDSNSLLFQIVTWLDRLTESQRKTKHYNKQLIQWLSVISFLPAREYQPTLKQVTTWLSDNLQKKLKAWKERVKREQQRFSPPIKTEQGEIPMIDVVPSPSMDDEGRFCQEIVAKIWEWLKTDPEGVLQSTCFRKRSQINARVLIWRWCQCKLEGTSIAWNTVAAEFNLSSSDTVYLPKWYNRACMPKLKNFLRGQM